MKKDTHPKYNPLKIIIGQDQFSTFSTLHTGELLMDVDFRKHPAWNKATVNLVNQSNKNVSDFNKKFGSINFGFQK